MILEILALTLAGSYLEGERLRSRINEPPKNNVSGELVSVIVPALQEELYLPSLLNSIANQSYSPTEVIIVDSSPPDSKLATIVLANQYGARVIDVPKGNVSQARNEGANNANGTYLLILDADCIMCADYVERMVKHLDNGYVLAHGVDCFFDSSLQNMGKAIERYLKPVSYTTGRGIAMRKADFLEIGGYDETCNPFDDG